MKKYSLLLTGLLTVALCMTWQSCQKENQPPVAQFSIDPTTGNDQTTFVMDASGTSDPNDKADALVIMWDYDGDGSYDTQYATRKTGDHKYTKPGNYTVTMVVKDPRGLTDTMAVPLVVTSSNLPPEVPFDPQPADGSTVLSVNPWMRWGSSDPEGDPMFFTCFFGKTNPPEQLIASQMLGTFTGGELEYGTTYYWKIRVRDSKGNITMGPVWSFTTYDLHFITINDSRDGQTYKAVQMGDAWWMAENLRYDAGEGSYCYENNLARCQTYGRLYTWDAAMKSCPAGWHLPSVKEFETMINLNGGTEVAGTKLKDNVKDLWKESSIESTNEVGFSALPAGRRYDSGLYAGLGYYAQFFASTEYNSREAYNMTIGYDYANTFIYNYKKAYAISVRCVKD
ncbi:MAG: FISUMP domain-containing protein [Bacteroidales bacterium]|nr:FISUMP domain-containing protein [Bacteroidales bacterium]